ncbi:SigE family RNA polymerase sigma factor [Nonomuraea sp. LPB2021202275-12-8]|uniref:SigE family RNA polymerase sigma factor n=1 Tax=Nonomuraea sp. LPB2021202275-12-8 TaxID=3120159 RepID=UPI00300CE393
MAHDFSAFVRHRGAHHLRTAVLLTGDWHAAEDLLQSCLVKLYRSWPRLDTATDPDAYLRRILVNTHRSWWRVSWRRETPSDSMPEPAAGQDDPVLALAVRQALKVLPPRQRLALVLRYFEDLPQAQVAELMGCSVGSVKTHTHRGVRRLREVLGEELVPEITEMEAKR